MMGIGNVTTEQLVYDETGRLLTDGTWEYKPPCSKTIPQVNFTVVPHFQGFVQGRGKGEVFPPPPPEHKFCL